MASLMRSLETSEPRQAERESAEMAKRFEKAFWMPETWLYAMALDRERPD